MRVRFFPLLAAAGVVLVLIGPASAQYRGYNTPSNFGMSSSWYRPSNIGMSNGWYRPSNNANPGAGPIAGSYAGSLNPGSTIPLGSVGNLSTLSGAAPLGGGFGTFSVAALPNGLPAPTNTPMTANGGNIQPLNPSALLVPNNIAETTPTNPTTPTTPEAAAATAPNAATAPAPVPTLNPLAFGTTGTPVTGTPPTGSAPTVPNRTVPTTPYFLPYTAPQYQSSFYDPLRRVYGYSGY